MASTCICNLVHFVWSAKNRQPHIEDVWHDRLYGYFDGILRNNNAVPLDEELTLFSKRPLFRGKSSSYFTFRHRRSMNTLSMARPRPTILTPTPQFSSRPVNALAENWLP